MFLMRNFRLDPLRQRDGTDTRLELAGVPTSFDIFNHLITKFQIFFSRTFSMKSIGFDVEMSTWLRDWQSS